MDNQTENTENTEGGQNEVVARALAGYQEDKQAWRHVYEKAKDDLHFLSDAEDAQWDAKVLASRASEGRPAISADQLGQFVHQVVNDIRINTPTINVIPGGMEADAKNAEIFKGLIKNIEYSSNADNAYDTAATFAVKCSIGFIRIDHEYDDDCSKSFDQKLVIKRVTNPFSVTLDRKSVEPDGSDAMRGLIKETMTVKEHKERWPNKDVASFEDGKGEDIDLKDTDDVTVVEYFEVIEECKTIGIDNDDKVQEYVEGTEYKKTRKIKKRKVMRYMLNGKEVLEETTFPGKHIPLIPVYGEEAWIDGKRHVNSLIRKSKDAQRMFNYWKSLETELLMKQPQAPVMAAEGQTEEYEEDWTNPSKAYVLRYKTTDVDGKPVPPPQRLNPPTLPTGVVNASRSTVDDIKATMGMYNASIGAKSNETSGVAINQRKMEGDIATYHFGDNLVKSITHVGRVLADAIPHIYDTKRVIRIIGEEDEPKQVSINGAKRQEKQEEDYDLTKGRYDVKVVTGAAFTTRRQEAAALYEKMITGNGDMMKIMGDLYFKYSDVSGSDAMAERMKKIIDPNLLEEDERKQGEEDPEKMQMMQALQQAQQQIQQITQHAQALEEELKNNTLVEQSKSQTELLKAQSAKETAHINAQVKMAEYALKEKELEVKKLELEQTQPQYSTGIGEIVIPQNHLEGEHDYE